MANLNLSNFIVDRVISGVGYRSDDSVLFKMDQCQDTSITFGSESTDIVDNVGCPIMTLYRSKTCEISGSNAILDFNLTAVQMGTEKNVADKKQWIKNNATEFRNLGLKIDSLKGAEDIFVNNTTNVVNALKARASAMAAQSMLTDAYTEYYKSYKYKQFVNFSFHTFLLQCFTAHQPQGAILNNYSTMGI